MTTVLLIQLLKFNKESTGSASVSAYLNAKGTVRVDVPQGKPLEPSGIYNVLRLPKFASNFVVGDCVCDHVVVGTIG